MGMDDGGGGGVVVVARLVLEWLKLSWGKWFEIENQGISTDSDATHHEQYIT